MSCPTKYLNKKLEIKPTVTNHDFFSHNNVNDWTFKNFLKAQSKDALKRLKTELLNYRNSLSSLISKHKQQIDPDLLGYLVALKKKEFTDSKLKDFARGLNKESVSTIAINNSTISHSNIASGSGSANINITQPKGKRKQNHEHVTVKRKKDSFMFLRPITPSIAYHFNTPNIHDQIKVKIDSIAYIQLNDKDDCENELIKNEYLSNMRDSLNNKYITQQRPGMSFLKCALEQDIDHLLPWMGSHGFDADYDNDTKKLILFLRLALTDFYANCLKPTPKNTLNERTPFVEYIVPIFKYYSAVYQDTTFQWCEKGLETNKCVVYYSFDDKAKKRLADGIGYFVADNNENLLIESSGEANDNHTQDVTIKLLECSIRALKLEMERMKDVSFESYKKRKMYTFLYASDKLTMLNTSVVNQDKWGYTVVREANIPRTWDERTRWLKVTELILCTKVKLEEQRDVTSILEKEQSGWSLVTPGASIKDLSK